MVLIPPSCGRRQVPPMPIFLMLGQQYEAYVTVHPSPGTVDARA
jgi:hypothetical protein